MNHDLWEAHITARVRELERELTRARKERDRQRNRAEYWAARALSPVKPSLAAPKAMRVAGTRRAWRPGMFPREASDSATRRA